LQKREGDRLFETHRFIAGDEVEVQLPISVPGSTRVTIPYYDHYFADRRDDTSAYEHQVEGMFKFDIKTAEHLLAIDDLGMANDKARSLTSGMNLDCSEDTGWLYDERWPVDFRMLTSKFRSMFVPESKRNILQPSLE
jgi:hypothetical protein